MSIKYSLKKNRNTIIIWILSLVILITSILYFAERNKYVNESEKLEKVNMYLYELEVKSPLRTILNFLGSRPVESVNWDDEQFRMGLQSTFSNLDYGLMNIDNPAPQIVPDNILLQLHYLQEKVFPVFTSIHREEPLDERTKVKIMNFSESIYFCEVSELTSSWKQVETKLDCLNESMAN